VKYIGLGAFRCAAADRLREIQKSHHIQQFGRASGRRFQDYLDLCLEGAPVQFGTLLQLFNHGFVKLANQYLGHKISAIICYRNSNNAN
jgi:hypothetical protein